MAYLGRQHLAAQLHETGGYCKPERPWHALAELAQPSSPNLLATIPTMPCWPCHEYDAKTQCEGAC